jgi:hypothetical protein
MLHPDTAAPKQFWPELLAYTVPLIESCQHAIFSSADVFIFMQVSSDRERERERENHIHFAY